MVKKHAAKIVLVLLALLFVATLWFCSEWLGRISQLCNRVNAQSVELTENWLNEVDAPVTGADGEGFEDNSVLNAIRDNWSEGTTPPDYTASMVIRPAGP